ncbi:MAG TPA: NAD(P)-binding domain-containing protein [Candidatus Krumholzibacteria bacterium]|nr:NAD(P)-binding domain-containing protein [Candidatus Krumholzibacteria bacterium]
MRVGILGSGDVGKALAAGFSSYGHDVTMGTRDPAKLGAFASQHKNIKVGSFGDAAKFGEIIVLAVKGVAAADVLRDADEDQIEGKVIVDTTNPIADAPPKNGVLDYFTDDDESLMERLQREFSGARFVKAFSCVGSALMVNPKLRGGPPTMFICGDDADAKALVSKILAEFGWEVEDMGSVTSARAIEPLAILWCIPGFLRNDWSHAFKLLR